MMALSLQPKVGLGSSVVGDGEVQGLLSPISPPPGLCWAFNGPATLSWLSQCPHPLGVTAREGRSGACGSAGGVAPWDNGGGPLTPLGPPTSHRGQASSVPRLSPRREWGASGAGGCPSHGGPRCLPHGDMMSLLPGPQGPHRLLHRTCTKSVAGDRDAPSLESRWM